MANVCRDCKFALVLDPEDKTGEVQCRRHAPTPLTVPLAEETPNHSCEWPLMYGEEWCGEYKPSFAAKERDRPAPIPQPPFGVERPEGL